jgi:predicted DNA-binding protein (MmcQ/YjbR family)
MKPDHAADAERLRAYALGLPGAVEDFPWGERVVKVAKKVFVFLGRSAPEKVGLPPQKSAHVGAPGDIRIGVKLPHSGPDVLSLPCAAPMAYGLGKSGWITLTFTAREAMPVELVQQWIEESYRAVAPRKLIAQLAKVGSEPGGARTKTAMAAVKRTRIPKK